MRRVSNPLVYLQEEAYRDEGLQLLGEDEYLQQVLDEEAMRLVTKLIKTNLLLG
jgi:hypothetical protein